MLEFKEITISDREWMEPLFKLSDCRSEEYSFTFTYIWRNVFGYKAARVGDFLIIKADRMSRSPVYLFPPGRGDIGEVMSVLEKDAAQNGHALIFHPVLKDEKHLLECQYPGRFSFEPLSDYFDYIYDAQSMITLTGKKLHAKRNHINRFIEANPDWAYEPITPENVHEVLMMNDDWLRINMSGDSSKTLIDESRSVSAAINEFAELNLDGGLIRAGGRVVAFSIGDKLNFDTYLVQAEKAYGEIQGAYAIINREFAKHNCQGFTYIDREDDSGDEGLRKAKKSYYPVFMVEKYAARLMSRE